MTYKFSKRSNDALAGVHPDLVRVMRHAIINSPVDFVVLEGLRSIVRQRELYAAGATTTMNSRHITGHAVDIAPVVGKKVRFDWPLYYMLAPHIKNSAAILEVPLVWGGDWLKFRDGPHFELHRSTYR